MRGLLAFLDPLFRRAALVVEGDVRCENSSGCQDVLVNHTAETIAPLDTSLAALRRWRRWRRCRAGRREGQRSMRV